MNNCLNLVKNNHALESGQFHINVVKYSKIFVNRSSQIVALT